VSASGTTDFLISRNATTFPSLATGVYTTVIPINNPSASQTNALVKVEQGYVFKMISSLYYPRWAGNTYVYDGYEISLDGYNFSGASQFSLEIAGPAWVRLVYNSAAPISNNVVTFAIYPNQQGIKINY
jgi:hypothetical protein